MIFEATLSSPFKRWGIFMAEKQLMVFEIFAQMCHELAVVTVFAPLVTPFAQPFVREHLGQTAISNMLHQA